MLFTGNIQNRLDQAKEFGFTTVEMWTPFAYDYEKLLAWKANHEIRFLMINTSPGDTDAGEWGTLCIPNRQDFFKADFYKTVQAADDLDCSMINVLVGKPSDELDLSEVADTLQENISWALSQVPENITLVVEALNKFDFPDSLFWKPEIALRFIKEIKAPRLKFLYDLYHASQQGLDIFQPIKDEINEIGHIQIADYPGRNQPGTGMIDFKKLFNLLEQVGYQGVIGLEYKPVGSVADHFSWINKYQS